MSKPINEQTFGEIADTLKIFDNKYLNHPSFKIKINIKNEDEFKDLLYLIELYDALTENFEKDNFGKIVRGRFNTNVYRKQCAQGFSIHIDSYEINYWFFQDKMFSKVIINNKSMSAIMNQILNHPQLNHNLFVILFLITRGSDAPDLNMQLTIKQHIKQFSQHKYDRSIFVNCSLQILREKLQEELDKIRTHIIHQISEEEIRAEILLSKLSETNKKLKDYQAEISDLKQKIHIAEIKLESQERLEQYKVEAELANKILDESSDFVMSRAFIENLNQDERNAIYNLAKASKDDMIVSLIDEFFLNHVEPEDPVLEISGEHP